METTKFNKRFAFCVNAGGRVENYQILNAPAGDSPAWEDFQSVGEGERIVSGMAFLDDADSAKCWQAKWQQQSVPAMTFVGEGQGMSSALRVGFSGCELVPIKDKGALLGYVYEDEFARYCMLTGVAPSQSGTRMEQTRNVFERIRDVLGERGFAFTDVFRTWLYVDHILDWYSDFNKVRTEFFNEVGMFNQLVPASTGIGLVGAGGHALTLGALALKKKSEKLILRAVSSPLQCSALNYKSSFSRAVELSTPLQRRLMISGTASIDPDGATSHIGDTELQIELTLDVVQALLESRGMQWGDVYRAIAYFRNAEDFGLYEKCRLRRGMPEIPLAYAHAHVCRHDLLFELEADAALEIQTCG